MKTCQGSCHCRRVRFEVDLDLDHVRVCDCSICFRRPRHRTPAEVAGGMPPFSGWTINVRCLEGVDLGAIPIQRVHGSKLD